MRKRTTRALLMVMLALVLYALFGVLADARKVGRDLWSFPIPIFLAACGLAMTNYVVRFFRWSLYLKTVGASVPVRQSLVVFLSGFVMAVSPGKVGEVLKAYLLKESAEIRMADTIPVVVAERLTDLIAILMLTLLGVGAFPRARFVVVAGTVIVVVMLVVIAWRSACLKILSMAARLPKLGGIMHHLERSYESMYCLVSPGRLVGGVLIGVVAWLCEALAFYLVLNGFAEVHPTVVVAVFIYAFATAAGALSFLPGGLGVTEGGMVALVVASVAGASRASAVAATVIIRLATLWLAVGIGFAALAFYRKRYSRGQQGAHTTTNTLSPAESTHKHE